MADYITAHLSWIVATKTFVPRYVTDYHHGTYYDVMKFTYENLALTCSPDILREYAKSQFVSDKLWHKQTFALSKEVDRLVEKSLPSSSDRWFMTIGFNHDTWTIKDCDKCIRKILEFDWIISAKANFELFRVNGEHPHCHFIIETKEPKSRILEKVYRPLYTKKVVFSKNFIDLKPMMDYHLKYINLDKVSDKMENVKKDMEWRKKNNIPDYEKSWIETTNI